MLCAIHNSTSSGYCFILQFGNSCILYLLQTSCANKQQQLNKYSYLANACCCDSRSEFRIYRALYKNNLHSQSSHGNKLNLGLMSLSTFIAEWFSCRVYIIV